DSLRQLRQRITFSYTLAPLDRHATQNYVRHRLQVAGHRGATLFESRALGRIHRASHGIPRLVNVLCHKALMVAYGRGAEHVEARHARLAIADTEGAHWPRAADAPFSIFAPLSSWLAQHVPERWLP